MTTPNKIISLAYHKTQAEADAAYIGARKMLEAVHKHGLQSR
jgi:hypothetical protein